MIFGKKKQKIESLECALKDQMRRVEILDFQNSDLSKKCSYLEGILSAKEELLQTLKKQLEDDLTKSAELQKTVLNYLTVRPEKLNESINSLYEEDPEELEKMYVRLDKEGFDAESGEL